MKKAAPQYQQSSPSHGNSSTVETAIGLLVPLVLAALYWRWEVYA